jgi:hypothetical protein
MAFVPGAKNDVFISYAHFDNEGGATGERWVSDFAQRLEGALKQRLGCPVDIYFDTRSLEGHQVLSEILENVRRSAVFVPILSPSYVNREWTKAELEAFVAADIVNRIIFTIERLPLDEEAAYPESLRERKRTQFWFRTEDSGVVDILTPALKPERYFGAITDVVDHMARQLRTLKSAGGLGAPPSVVTGDGIGRIEVVGEGPPVLLAQVTEDLDEQRDQVRRHLEQFNLRVLPANLYPQGGADFARAFSTDLADAALFVQLLGPVAGRRPPDLPQGYAQFQYEAAAAKGIPTMLWRRPDLDPTTVTGPHAALLGAPSVQAMSMQAFKAEIVRRMTAPPPPPPKPATARSASTVFINAVQGDIDLAAKLEDDFVKEGCTVLLPVMDGPAEEILRDLSENMVDCDALILVYGSAENMWVRSQLKLYNKLKPKRAENDCVVVICNAPPAPKAPIGMRLPEAYEIDYGAVLDSEPVVQLLSRSRH